MRFWLVAFVLVTAGCTAPADNDGVADGPAADGAVGGAVPVALTIPVALPDGAFDVAALGWNLDAAAAVTLGIHGSAGVKENNWAATPVPGYSLAEREAAAGRAFVAIDLPGYGETAEASEGSANVDRFARVVLAVADALRAGGDVWPAFATVHAVGHSMGGLIVDVAQGHYAAAGAARGFDAVVVAGWAHSGLSDALVACLAPGAACADVRDQFFSANVDDTVVNWMMERFETAPGTSGPQNLAFNMNEGESGTASRTVAVPVFVVVGGEDWYWQPTSVEQEKSAYPNAPRVDVLIAPDDGHFVFHHLDHDTVQAAVTSFLTSVTAA